MRLFKIVARWNKVRDHPTRQREKVLVVLAEDHVEAQQIVLHLTHDADAIATEPMRQQHFVLRDVVRRNDTM